MSELKVKTLSNASMEMIHDAWIKVFEDYQVDIQLSMDQLAMRLKQVDVSLDVSVGLYDGRVLVGFWLNGLRDLEGVKTAYDAGTGIWKEYRGKGVSRMLASASNDLLKKAGVKRYILEVLDSNERAYNLYLNDGFRVTRRFDCFKTRNPSFEIVDPPSDIRITESVFKPELIELLPHPEYIPSWQNSVKSMTNIMDTVHMVVAQTEDAMVGYGLIQPSDGRISQIAIRDRYWRSSLPSVILQRLCEASQAGEVVVVNVEVSAHNTIALLRKHGFERFVGQFEMEKLL